MTRVLVLGGYGGFGGRISHRLAAQGHDVLVAGRNLAKARVFCAQKAALVPLCVDRAAIGPALAEHRPDIVVDASGPFQAMDFAIPRACIDAGIHYLDIADSREFVCGVGVQDAAAKIAGVIVISGASSVPALSGAVVRHLAGDITQVDAVEMAISASNRAAAGPAVAASSLSQVGQPMPMWQGKRWIRRFGWQGSASKSPATEQLAVAWSGSSTSLTSPCFPIGCRAVRRLCSVREPNLGFTTSACGWPAGLFDGAWPTI